MHVPCNTGSPIDQEPQGLKIWVSRVRTGPHNSHHELYRYTAQYIDCTQQTPAVALLEAAMAITCSDIIILITCAPWSSIASAELSSQRSFIPNQDGSTMPQSLEPFVESPWLPSSDAEQLNSTLARNTEASTVSQACTAAQLLLGSAIVNTPPVQQSTVDASWFVPFLHEYER